MLDPEYLANVSEGAEEIASDLHTSIIKQIVKRITYRLGQGKDFSLSQTDRYQIEVLQEAGFLLEDIMKEITAETKKQSKEVKAAFEDAGVRSVRAEASVYETIGISNESLLQSPAMIRILQRSYEATMQEWQNYTRTTAISAQKLFINECDKAYNRVIAGEVSYSQAFYDAIKNIAEGPGAVVEYPKKDKNGTPIPGTVGWIDTIEVATARAVRTGIVQATSDITATRAAENGVTCFLVSKHQGARPTHAEWQGQVYWVDWDLLRSRISIPDMDLWPEASGDERSKYKEFCRSTGIGEMLGLCGINCRHSYGPFFDGVSHNPYDSIQIDEDPEIYENEQKQRELERRIRKTKRELITLTQARNDSNDEFANLGLDKAIQHKNNLLVKQNAQYNQFCKEHDLRPQEQRLTVADWNRSIVKEIELAENSVDDLKLQTRRKMSSDGTYEVIDKATMSKAIQPFLKSGGIIIQGKEADAFLDVTQADAAYMRGENLIFLRAEPKTSDVLEETYHALQDRRGDYSDRPEFEMTLLREIDAQKYLQKIAKRYKIPEAEQEHTALLLKKYEAELKRYYGE